MNSQHSSNSSSKAIQALILTVFLIFLGLFSTAKFFGNEYLIYIHNHPSYSEPSVFRYSYNDYAYGHDYNYPYAQNYYGNYYGSYNSAYSRSSYLMKTGCASAYGCPSNYGGVIYSYTPQGYANYAQPWYLR
jgi:hypothetical protein